MNAIPWQTSDARDNQLLAELPDAAWARWEPHLRSVELECGQTLGPPGLPLPNVIFPTSAIVSLMCTTQDGACAEVCVVGNDGAVGMSLFLGGNGVPSQPVVQSAGRGFRLPAKVVTDEINRGGLVLNMMLRYGQAMFAQVAQTALCNRYHSIDQQLCRRLLIGLDRSQSNELAMTHAGMAGLLGVRREGITAAAYKLQRAGVINYTRGRLVVRDREELERRACECYAAAREEHDRWLPLSVGAWLPAGTGGAWARRRTSATVDRFAGQAQAG